MGFGPIAALPDPARPYRHHPTEQRGRQFPGQLTQTPVEVTAAYDGLNRITKARQRKKSEANYRFTTFTYDLNSNVDLREDNGEETAAGVLVKAGRKHDFDYNGGDRLTQHLDFGTNATSAADDQRITNQFAPTGWETQRKVEANNGTGVWSVRQTTDWAHFANGKLKTLTTKNGSNAVIESHTVSYEDALGRYLNGNRTKDVFTMQGPDTAAPCRTTACTVTFSYDARERLTKQETKNSSGSVVNSTTYTLDNAGNIATEQFARGGATTSKTMTYAGDRLTTVSTGGSTQKHWYDPDGNLDCVTTDTGTTADCNTATGNSVSPKLLADYGYDYLNRLQSFRSFATNGTTSVKDDSADYTYDALDRTAEQTESHGTAQAKTTLFSYLGLTTQQSEEQQKNTSTGALVTTKTVGYDAFGNKTSLTTTPASGTATTDTFAYDVHGSVSLLVNSAGSARAAYGYKPYGEADPDLTKGDANDDDPVNPFRYTGKRFDSGSGSLDMGARRFGPSTARFLQEDKLDDAFEDLELSFDPLTQNRYGLAGGNPINFVEVDGHKAIPDGSGGGSTTPQPLPPCAASLKCTRQDFDKMSIQQRRDWLKQFDKTVAAKYRAQGWFAGVDGILRFFERKRLAKTGNWWSVVDAEILRGIQDGAALAEGAISKSDNPGAAKWKKFFERRREDAPIEESKRLWGEAEQESTMYGIDIARRDYGLKSTKFQQTFVAVGNIYRTSMGNKKREGVGNLFGWLICKIGTCKGGGRYGEDGRKFGTNFFDPRNGDATYHTAVSLYDSLK